MRLAPRWRILLGLVLAGIIGYLYLTWALQLGLNLVHAYHHADYVQCRGSWHDLGYACDPNRFSTSWAWLLLVVASLLSLGVGMLLTGWALRPVRSLTRSVARLGPQNLGERNNFPPANDEVTRLAQAIDAMMDRVAEGYEGQRRFAANASHELRTPLAVQRTLIEVSMTGDTSPQQLELLARQLLSANERNENLIEGLLVLAESDRGLASSTPQRLDEIATEVIGYHRQLAKEAGVELHCELAEVTIAGERALLERLLANLVQNAIKYNRPAGWLRLQIGPGPRMKVSNSGTGVDESAVPALFEPFRRLSAERINHRSGSGLGLTIARSISQAHGGVISARSNRDGGLDVEVQLPG